MYTVLHTNLHSLQEPYLIIVDDDQDDRALIQDCFLHLNWHHHVQTLNDADALLELLDAIPDPKLFPTLIILDYNLPRLGGETALMVLKKDERFKRIPVVLYSTSMNEKKEKQLLGLGAHFCRSKPTPIDGMHWLMVELMDFAKSHHKALFKKKAQLNSMYHNNKNGS